MPIKWVATSKTRAQSAKLAPSDRPQIGANLGVAVTIASVRRVAEKNERRAARLSKSADHKAKAHAAKRLRSPETRGGVHAFHARRRALDVPYDPGIWTPLRAAGRRGSGRRLTRGLRRSS